jgi:hypothetical protein
MAKLEPGSGPPFTVTVQMHCPGLKHNMMCGGSAWQVDKLRRREGDDLESNDPLWFCAGVSCPLMQEGRSFRVVKIETLLPPGTQPHSDQTAKE